MKIKKVIRIQNSNSDCLEVLIEDEGEETIINFAAAEQALQEIDGEPVFIKQLREEFPKIKASRIEAPVEPKKIEIKKFKDQEVILWK